MHNEIELVIKESGLEQSTASAIEQKFLPLFKQAAEWKEKALTLVVTEEGDKEKMKQAREARLFLKGIRVSAEKVKKELKQDSLRYGRAVEGVYNVIEYLIVPIEEHLDKQENYDKIKAEERRNQLRIDRTETAKPLAEFLPIGLDFGIMTDDDFTKLISGANAQQKMREEEERKEQERLIIEKLHYDRAKYISSKLQFVPEEYTQQSYNLGLLTVEAWEELTDAMAANEADYVAEQYHEEQRRLLHNERYKYISGLLRWLPKEYNDAHFGEMEEDVWTNLVATLEEKESNWNIEQDKIRKENERLRKEQEKARQQREKEQAVQQAKLDLETKKREAAEKELADKKAEEARLEAEKLAAQEDKLKKADKDKFQSFLVDLDALKESYQFKSKKYNTLYTACNDLIDKIINYAKSKQ